MPFSWQIGFAIQIRGLCEVAGMTRAVQFNREMSFGTEKIEDAIAMRDLSAEFQTA